MEKRFHSDSRLNSSHHVCFLATGGVWGGGQHYYSMHDQHKFSAQAFASMAWELNKQTWPVDGEDLPDDISRCPSHASTSITPALVDLATGDMYAGLVWKDNECSTGFGKTQPVVTGIQPVVTGMRKLWESLLVMDMMAISAGSRRIGVDIGVMSTWKSI